MATNADKKFEQAENEFFEIEDSFLRENSEIIGDLLTELESSLLDAWANTTGHDFDDDTCSETLDELRSLYTKVKNLT